MTIDPKWLAVPIGRTCGVTVSYDEHLDLCGRKTFAAYPTPGGGWQALCASHARKHLHGGAFTLDELLAAGGKLE